jgi:hypothetical protein
VLVASQKLIDISAVFTASVSRTVSGFRFSQSDYEDDSLLRHDALQS